MGAGGGTALYRLHKDDDGKWHFTLLAANGEPVAVGTEAYSSKADCYRGCKDAAAAAEEAVVESDVIVLEVRAEVDDAEPS